MNKNLNILLLLLVVSACATMSPPEGGARDEEPPNVVSCDPPNQSVKFEPQEVKITFDEFIQIVEARNRVLISPPLEKKPLFQRKRKSVVFEIPEGLKDSTTYNIYLGNSIADITEGNEISNYKYTFSTGNHVDSMVLDGYAREALSHKTEEDWIIMLYREDMDSLPLKQEPYYVSKTNEQGYFRFENLAAGAYKIFGLKDQNNNYIYDQPSEWIAFSDSLIRSRLPVDIPDSLQADTIEEAALSEDSLMEDPARRQPVDSMKQEKSPPKTELVFFQQTDTVQRLKDANAINPWVYQFQFRYPVKKLNLSCGSGLSFDTVMNKQGDKLTLYFEHAVEDSLKFVFADQKYEWHDTDWVEPEKQQKSKAEIISNIQQGALVYNQPFKISSSVPFAMIDNNKIVITEKTDTIVDTLALRMAFCDTVSRQELFVSYEWNENSNYSVTAYPGAIKLLDSLSNDTVRYTFSIKPRKEFGNIVFELKNTLEGVNYIVQLLESGNKVIKQVNSTGQEAVEFNDLAPKIYKIRVIEDRNNNRQWDTGIYLEGLQPERSWFFHKEFEVRANWDVKEAMDMEQAEKVTPLAN
ncbi:MAG: Ig-like domain-containing protein [Bacteroidales bacterium]